MNTDYPILEFDGARDALIEPSKVIQPVKGFPERCVLPMFYTVIDGLKESLVHVTDVQTSMGPMPIYKINHDATEVVVAHPGLGAPLCVGVMEEIIAMGCRKFIACGSAGVLDGALAKGTI